MQRRVLSQQAFDWLIDGLTKDQFVPLFGYSLDQHPSSSKPRLAWISIYFISYRIWMSLDNNLLIQLLKGCMRMRAILDHHPRLFGSSQLICVCLVSMEPKYMLNFGCKLYLAEQAREIVIRAHAFVYVLFGNCPK